MYVTVFIILWHSVVYNTLTYVNLLKYKIWANMKNTSASVIINTSKRGNCCSLGRSGIKSKIPQLWITVYKEKQTHIPHSQTSFWVKEVILLIFGRFSIMWNKKFKGLHVATWQPRFVISASNCCFRTPGSPQHHQNYSLPPVWCILF